MNKIYKIVWNTARGCYVVASELVKSHHKKSSSRSRKSLRAFVLLGAACLSGGVSYADVVVKDCAYSDTVSKTAISGGTQYTIENQQVSSDKTKALNQFTDFDISQGDVANLQLGNVDKQINLVDSRINVDGVVNAIKDNQIGGDVYFFSGSGIAVGASGVFNVGRLTLGTNTDLGTQMFAGTGYDNMPLKTLADAAAGDSYGASITMEGTVNAKDSVAIGASGALRVGDKATIRTGSVFHALPAGASSAASYGSLINLNGITTATTASKDKDGIVLLSGGNMDIGGVLESHGRDISATAKKEGNLSITGGKVLSDGGKIALTATTDVADLQAEASKSDHGGVISIKEAYIDSGSEKQKSGDMEITAARTAMGTAAISVDASTLDASGKSGNQAGDVTIHATAQTLFYSWDIGDGVYANIDMGQQITSKRNTILGDNIDILARASNDGSLASNPDGKEKTDEEIAEAFTNSIGFFEDKLIEFRPIAAVTKVHAEADVNIDYTNMKAVGTGADTEKHGDISIASEATSRVQTTSLGGLGLGFVVGISDAKSHVDVDNSTLYAQRDLKTHATVSNTVLVDQMETGLLQDTGEINISYADLTSEALAHIAENTTVTTGRNTDVSALSTRRFSVECTNDGNVSAALAIGIVDTKAKAHVDGAVYAAGDVTVTGTNTMETTDSGVYRHDYLVAGGIQGDSGFKPLVTLGKEYGSLLFNRFKTKLFGEKVGGAAAQQLNNEKSFFSKLGVNAAAAYLNSANNSEATVTGTIRGAKEVGGVYVGDASLGAKSLAAKAETISRAHAATTAFEMNTTQEGGEQTKSSYTTAVAFSYLGEDNHATAYVADGADVKTVGDVTVNAETKMPYQTVWQGTSFVEIAKNLWYSVAHTNLGLPLLVDSWAQTAGKADKASGAVSVGLVNYNNSSKAYIGKSKDSAAAPIVSAGGDVNVNAKTAVTTVNLSGTIQQLFDYAPINMLAATFGKMKWDEVLNKNEWFEPGASTSYGLGGSVLRVHQTNNAEAFIDGGAKVTADKSVKVAADTVARNFAISTAGGKAKSVAFDATVSMNLFDNDTKAYIGDATVTSKEDTKVSADDDSWDINLAGAVGATGASGIGASIAYNHISRETEAYINGIVQAGRNVAVSAKNDGYITAASLAGAVAYDGTDRPNSNHAGSWGDHVRDPTEQERIDGLVGLLPEWEGEVGAGGNDLQDEVNEIVQEVAGEDDVMDDNVNELAEEKNKLTVAANLSINRLTDTAKAHVGNGKAAPAVSAKTLDLSALNDSAIYAITGSLSANMSAEQGKAIGGSFMWNSIVGTTEAYVNGANLTISGDDDEDKALSVSAHNKERILNLAASGSGTGRGFAGAGQISVNKIDDTTTAYLKDSAVHAAKAMTVKAIDEGTLDSYTGAVSFAGNGGTALGAAIAANLVFGTTKAYAEDNDIGGVTTKVGEKTETKKGSLSLTAESKTAVSAVAASGTLASDKAGSFSAVGNKISTTAEAHLSNAKAKVGGVYAIDVDGLTVSALNHGTATTGVGALGVGSRAVGASIGVMIDEGTAKAYVEGDADKKNTLKASSLTVKAENSYNGDAKDNEDDSTSKTVAVGAAGGAEKFSGAGSVTVNKIKQTTDAYLGAGNFDISNGTDKDGKAVKGAASITAKSSAKLFGLAGGLSLAAGSGIGVGVDIQAYDGHTWAGIADGAYLHDASATTVEADSSEKLTSIGASGAVSAGTLGGAGAAGAHSIVTNTKAYIGDNKENSEGAELSDAGAITVHGKDDTTLRTGSGAAGGSTGEFGVGLSAAVEVVNKTVEALAGNNSTIGGKSLAVLAENTGASTTAAAALGVAGTAGIAGAASETFVDYTTKAHIGKRAQVTTDGAVAVKADSSFKQGSGAGGAGVGGTFGLGVTNSTVSYTATTESYVDTDAAVDSSAISVEADQKTDVTYATVAGGGAGTVAINGAIGVNVLDTHTKAYTGNNVSLKAKNAIDITAKDETILDGGNGGVAIGLAAGGGGLTLGVNKVIKDTEAFTGTGALLNTTADSAGSRISISARNAEALRNITMQGAGGTWAGIAGATNLTYITATTKAYTGSNTSLVQGTISYDDKGDVKDITKASGTISVDASHDIGSAITRIGDEESSLSGMSSYVIGAQASAGGSVGAAVDVAAVVTKTNAYLGNGNTVKSKGDLSVAARDTMKNISSASLAASVGAVGITGSFSVYNFGSDLTDDDKKTLSAKAEEGGKEQTLTDWLDKELKNTNISKGFETYNSGALSSVKAKLSTEYSAAAPTMDGAKGTLAAIGGVSAIDARNVSVKANDRLAVEQNMGSVTGSALVSAGATVTKVTTDTLTQARVDGDTDINADRNISIAATSDHRLDSMTIGAGISAAVGLQGTVSTWNDTSRVRTIIGEDSHLTAEGAVRITSANTRTMDSALTGATAALFGAANGAVIYASIDGDALTTIGNGVAITSETKDKDGESISKEDITIDARADTTLVAGAVGAAVGAFGGTGTGTSLASDVTAKTSIGNQAQLTGKNISITAENTPILKATATSAGLGLAGVGITVAKTDSKDKAQVAIGNSTALAADEALTIKASMAKPTDTDSAHAYGLNGYASATAGAGGVVSGAVATAFVDTDQVTSVEIGTGNTLKAKTAAITSDHQDAENVIMNTISAGASTGLGGEMGTTVKSDSHVTIGDGSTITTTDETKILASNDTEKSWRDGRGSTTTAFVGGAGLASGSGVVNKTAITHDTNVNLGKVTLTANAADLTDAEKASGVTAYDKNAIDINAKSHVISKDDLNLTTGAAILSSYAKNTNTVTANTAVTVADGASLKAGDTEGVKETHTETYADPSGKTYSKSYRGGSIAVGTRNDAELDSSTMVDIYGAAGHAGSSNDVTYNNRLTTTFGGTAETAKGDISIAAGRDSRGETGTVKVTARSDVLNATLIPISYTYDPVAKVDAAAQLTLTSAADLKSDRDISLKAKTGDITAMGYGETKSWVNSVKDIFGEGVNIGKTEKTSTANVEVNGKAETGIHRNKTVQMGGYIDSTTGKWVTTVSGNGDISYSFSNSHAAGSDLYAQYEALKAKLEEYSADPAAKAGYEAEMKFLQQKMVEQGLAYYDDDKKKNFVLVKNAGSTTEIESAAAQLTEMRQEQQEAIRGFDTLIGVLDKEKPLLQDMLDKCNNAVTAAETYGTGSTEYAAAAAAYKEAVEKHNEAMGSSYYNTDITADTVKELTVDINELESLHAYYETVKTQWADSTEINRLGTQIEATKKFFEEKGGVEDTTTGSFKLDGQTVEAVDAAGNPVNPKTAAEGTTYYYLLHKESYNYLLNDLQLDGITSQLGDIDLEGDNVYGSGTLNAPGNGSVKITNDSPNNLKVGDITVAGSRGTSGAGQGGTIYYNNSAIRGDASKVKDTIQELNADGTKSVGFTVKTRDTTDNPSVEIQNNFKPNERKLGNLPVFGPSQTYLTGYIYNPRGSVHGVSEYGDIYNQGTILSGTVNLEIKNGDYIQSYNLEKSGTVTNVGGAPLTDEGEKKDSVGEGITANGNIFISARYLNINSKIQSGYSDVSIHIPEEGKYKLYYMNGSEKKYVTSKDQLPTDRTVTVHVEGDGLSAEGAKLLTFDFDSNRFLLNDVETGGGHISLVGTILNTTQDTSKAKIEARDGYGNITIINDSAKDLEIQSLSTGTGAKGVIEITDLDYRTGQITRKTTYTREDGKIQALVEWYEDGEPTGQTNTNSYDGQATYNPSKGEGDGLWYNYQTGQQTSYTATYKFDGSKFDWWGINGHDPSVEEMETYGAKTSDYSQGKTSALNGGAFISDVWQNGTIKTNTDDYKVTENTSSMDKQVVGFYKEAYRPFWTLWITKKYNYTLVEKKTDLQVKQFSLKADNPIGISFTGSANGGLIDITNTKDTNIRISGLMQNGEGVTNLTANAAGTGSIIQENPKGFIYTKDLNLVSGGSAGKKGAAIATNAENLTATSTTGEVAVSVQENVGGAVTLGNISAKTTASISSDGSIAQKEGASITARRIELSADDAVYGQKTESGTTALVTKLLDPTDTDKSGFYYDTGDAYGLYARANGDIYLRNEQYEKNGQLTGGDMYLDSVISAKGNVKLETEGSFLDANFSDQQNQSATEKLLHWAKEAVLEKEEATIEKQKTQLQALVEGKYSEYQSLKTHVNVYVLDDETKADLIAQGYTEEDLKAYRNTQQARYDEISTHVQDGVYVLSDADKENMQRQGYSDSDIAAFVEKEQAIYDDLKSHVKVGTYVLDDETRAMLEAAGYDEAAIMKYREDKQVEYNRLLHEWHVDTWQKDDVENYVNTLDSSLFGNARLKREDLSDDNFLSKEEKAAWLVNSAKSAEQLLVTMTPGGIKEGITDTRLTVKTTPHVSGADVSLIAEGKKNGDTLISGSGSIGQKLTGQVIDISSEEKIKNLTAAELLMLSSAERNDFQYDAEKGTVTVSFTDAITADTKESTDESGTVSGGTITAKAQAGSIYLESNGAFHKGSEFYSSDELRLKTSGDLDGITAGVGAGKNLVLESADGAISDVTIKGDGILTARAKNGVDLTKDEGDLIIYTVYASEGDVTIDMKDKGSLFAVSGYETAEDGEPFGTSFLNVEGRNIYIWNAKNVQGITDPVTGNPSTSVGLKATGTVVDADTATPQVTVPGQIQVRYTTTGPESDAVDVTLFSDTSSKLTDIGGRRTTITNKGHISAGTFTGTDKLTVYNTADGSIAKADDTAAPTFSGGRNKTEASTEKDGLSIINRGTITGGSFEAVKGDMTVTNQGQPFEGAAPENKDKGEIRRSTFIAKEGNITYNASGDTIDEELTFNAEKGGVTVTTESGRTLLINRLTAQTDSTVTAQGGRLALEDATVTDGDLTLTSKGNMTLGKSDGSTVTGITAKKEITATTTDGDLTATNLTADEGITATAGTQAAEGETKGTNTLSIDQAKTTTGVAQITNHGTGETVVKKLLVGSEKDTTNVGKPNVISGEGDVTVNYLNAYHDDVILTAGGKLKAGDGTAAADDWDISTLQGDIHLTSGGDMDIARVYTKQDITATSDGAIHAQGLTAGGTITVTGNGEGKDIVITKLESVHSSAITGKGDVTVTEANAGNTVEGTEDKLEIHADKDVIVGKAETNNALFTAGKDMKVDNLTARKEAKLESGGDMEVKTLTAGTAASLTSGGAMEVKNLTAGTEASLTSGGQMNVTKLTVTDGSAEISSTGGDVTVDQAKAKDSLTIKAAGTLTAGTETTKIETETGDMTFTSGSDMTITTAESGKDLTVTFGGVLLADKLTAKGETRIIGETDGKKVTVQELEVEKVTLTSRGGIEAGTITAHGSADITNVGDEEIIIHKLDAGSEKEKATGSSITNTQGNVTLDEGLIHNGSLAVHAGGTMTIGTETTFVKSENETDGDLTFTSGGDMIITTVESAKALTATSGGKLTADKLAAKGTVDLDSVKDLHVKDLTANVADIDVSEGHAKVDTATVTEKISIDTVKGNIETGTVTTKAADYNAGGTLMAEKLTATGTADLDSVGDLYVKSLEAGAGDLESKANAQVDQAKAKDRLAIKAAGTLKAGTGSTKIETENGDMILKSGSDMTLTTAESGRNLTATSGGMLTADKLIAKGTADLDSANDLHVKDLTANVADIDVSEGNVKVDKATITEKISIDTLKGNIETGTVTTKDADYNAGGTLTAEKLTATGMADLDSVGNLYVKDLSAGKADIDVTAGDATVEKALVQEALSITASGDVTAGTAETRTGSAAITAGQSVSIGTLTSGEKATVKAQGGDLTAEAITANRTAELDSAGKMKVENLISKEGDIVGTSGGAMDLHKVEALKGKVTLHSGSTLDVDDLDAKDADLTSKDTMTVIDSQIAETLTMHSGKDIVVNRSESVTLDMDADGSIKAETMNGSSAFIHTGSAALKAGGDILITDKATVEKLQGVDTSQPAGKTNGAGEAGSLYLADATPHNFDVSKKGDAVLSVDQALTMTGQKVEVDAVKTGSEAGNISINADNLGIDDLQSEADRLHVMIHGSDGKTQSHYAGLHTTSDKTVVVAGSQVETLNFTGKDDIGIEDTALGGDSTMQNSFIRFELRKNPRTDMAEWISKVHLKGYGIDTDHPMSRVDDGLPINGNPYEDTAYSAMNRSLFGGQYLGKDGREKEEDDSTTKDLRFGKVSPKESYEAVGASE